MSTTITNTEEAIATVLDGLCFLITHHAHCAASEQWSSSGTTDESDDYIHDHSEWVNKLRKIREDFENLATGFIPRNTEQTWTLTGLKNMIVQECNAAIRSSINADPRIPITALGGASIQELQSVLMSEAGQAELAKIRAAKVSEQHTEA